LALLMAQIAVDLDVQKAEEAKTSLNVNVVLLAVTWWVAAVETWMVSVLSLIPNS